MSETRNLPQNYRFRSIRAIAIISLAFFVVLFGWQLFVLITGSYPEHILPAVKIISGTQESVPVAYAWTLRLAVITVVGLLASSAGWITMNSRIKKDRANKTAHTTAGNAPA